MLKKIKISIRRKVIISRNIQIFLLLILCCFGFVVLNNISSNIIGTKFELLFKLVKEKVPMKLKISNCDHLIFCLC